MAAWATLLHVLLPQALIGETDIRNPGGQTPQRRVLSHAEGLATHAGTNGAADVRKSKRAGELVRCERPKTLADGLRGRMGDLTWPIVRDFVDDVITVTEEQIIDAMQLCFERMKVCLYFWPYCRPLSDCLEVCILPCPVAEESTNAPNQHKEAAASLPVGVGLGSVAGYSVCEHLPIVPGVQLVVEPSGAVGLAAVLTDTFQSQARYQDKRIGIVLCGGNVDLAAMGLWKQLRSAVQQL